VSINQEFLVGQAAAEWAEKARLSFWYQKETTSTNDQAKSQSTENQEPIRLYFTDRQTAGRGRGTNTWINEDVGNCLLSSWSFQLSKNPQPIMAPALGLAVYRALLASWPQGSWSMKAPNDIFLGDKKVAGILIENIAEGTRNRLILGLGINIFSKPDLPSAGSLIEQLSAISVQDLCQLLDRLLLEITMTLAGTGPELSVSQQDSLKAALNLSPLLQEKFIRVDGKGNLIKPSAVLRWSDL
jgi:BirA family transcriptional regulator, biotin operon repressor / biotin---[acetyl-CoA-carboxylase] ligase